MLDETETPRLPHALFGVSRFTYPGRNGTFLDLIGLHKFPLKKVVLLGSGPIEPFEVSALPRFRDAKVAAVDSDRAVYDLVCGALQSGQLDVGNLARICRSVDAENDYLLDVDRMFRQLNQVRHQGWQASWENASWENNDNAGAIHINQQLKGRLEPILCDLQNDMPEEVLDADLIFEGFMLINWAKSRGAEASVDLFLKRLSHRMLPNAWFASATSVTHYRGYAGTIPFFRQALSAGLFPAAGVLVRWSVSDKGEVTSQFGSVFRASREIETPLLNLGLTFEQDTLHWMSTFHLEHQLKIVDLGALTLMLEKGDVLSFRAIDQGSFMVLSASWLELSRRCQFIGRPYELKLDYDEQLA